MSSNVSNGRHWYLSPVAMRIINDKYLHEDEQLLPEKNSAGEEIPVYRTDGAVAVAVRLEDIMPTQELGRKIYDMFLRGDFSPGGRSLYGAGSKGKFKASMSNCYIMPMPEDNIESIMDIGKRGARIFSFGGGIGVNMSKLRPNGAKVHNSAKTSTGPCSYMAIYDAIGRNIGSNNRRAAMILGLSCEHPDIEEFLTIKQNSDHIKSANLSILFTDEFMKAVELRENFTLHFDVESEGGGQKIRKEINAYDFFHKFASAQHGYAEPGAIWIDSVRKHHYMSAYPGDQYKIDVCNPCVSGDTLILTKKGYFPIVDLVGKEVDVWNGYRFSKVIPKITGHNQKMKLIRFSNGMELKCTDYHKFVMKDGSRKKAEGLKAGDKLAKWEYPVIHGSKFLPSAYTQGFYSGDGTKDLSQICLYGEKKDLLPYIDYVRFTDQESQNRLCVVLNPEVDFQKAFVPDSSFTVASRLEWLSGLIDSDGCFNDVGGSIAISGINKEFLAKVQRMLSTVGAFSSLGIMHKEAQRQMPDGKGGVKDYLCQASYRLTISAFFVSELIKLGLETHRVKLEATPNRNASRFIVVNKIESIENEETVYCFNEPFNHTGIFNGIMTGQCAEYFGNAYNSCNLGSINLYNYVTDPFTKKARFDFVTFRQDVAQAIYALDAILDYGEEMQPLEANKEVLRDWRAIGLGIMGLADMFVALGIAYGSTESKEAVDAIMKEMQISAVEASVSLAKEHGPFPKYDYAKISKSPLFRQLPAPTKALVKEFGLRNCSLLSVAPTGSLSSMLGISGGAEPFFQISFERTTHAQEDGAKESFTVFAKAVEHLLEANNLNKDSISVEEVKSKFPFVVDAHEVAWKDRVELQAVMQKYVDNAISSTINLPEETSVEDIMNIYIHAWRSGCKGITIFRHNCLRPSILGVSEAARDEEKYGMYGVSFDSISPLKRKNLPEETEFKAENAIAHTACVKNMHGFITTLDDNLFEAFTFPSGGCTANIATITRLCSLAFRSGVKVSEVLSELRSSHCAACLKLREQGQKNISKSCGGAIADIIETCYHKKIEPTDNADMRVCPKCGEKSMMPGKCGTCANCGYNACT